MRKGKEEGEMEGREEELEEIGMIGRDGGSPTYSLVNANHSDTNRPRTAAIISLKFFLADPKKGK